MTRRQRWFQVTACAIAALVGGARPDAAPSPPSATKRESVHGGFVDAMDCSACHTAASWKLSATAGASGFDHDKTGFPLRGAHEQTVCTGCHTGTREVATTCEGCHRDPHAGRMDGACAECHRTTAWTDTSALDLHRRTRMPLTGRHAVIECTACHARQSERRFTDLPTDCYACHRTEYHRPDIHPDHDGDPADPTKARFSRDCARCHRTNAWSPAVIDPLTLPRGVFAAAQRREHDARFVVSTGPHRRADCRACHADARQLRRTRCDGCHRSEALALQHRRAPAVAGARAGSRAGAWCLRCHPRGTGR